MEIAELSAWITANNGLCGTTFDDLPLVSEGMSKVSHPEVWDDLEDVAQQLWYAQVILKRNAAGASG